MSVVEARKLLVILGLRPEDDAAFGVLFTPHLRFLTFGHSANSWKPHSLPQGERQGRTPHFVRHTALSISRVICKPAPVSLELPGAVQVKASGIASFLRAMKSIKASSMPSSSAGAS